MIYEISIGDKLRRVELKRNESGWQCFVDGKEVGAQIEFIDRETLSILLLGGSFEVRRDSETGIVVRGRRFEVSVRDPRSWAGRAGREAAGGGPQKLTASMPGKVVRVLAREGEKITAGQGIVVVEAMKMQNEVKSPREGILKKLFAQPGVNVNPGEVLAIVE